MTSQPDPGASTSAPATPHQPAATAESRPAAAPSALSGRRVLATGLVTGTIGLALSFFLQAVVANTPVKVSSMTLFWSTVLISCIGFGAGMAVEAVRQLSDNNPDPEYHRSRSRSR